jgi:phenylacetate-CoA ligase
MFGKKYKNMAKISDIFQKFIMSNPKRAMEFMSSMPASFWERQGRKKALSIFHEAAEKVPAYKQFLKLKEVNPKEIKTFEDFQKKVPIIDKKNYILQNPLKELCLDGKVEKMYTFSTSSGSEGTPVIWPRLVEQDKMLPDYWECFFIQNWNIDEKSTLVIITMALGNWIAGMLTTDVIKRIALKGKYRLSIATPGTDIKQILNIIKWIAPNYDQIIILVYPSLLKLIIEEGEKFGIKWRNLNLKFWLGGEKFSKNMRNYVIEKLGIEEKLDTFVSVYGTSDAGAIGLGSPLSNLIFKIISENERLHRKLVEPLPKSFSLVQCNPLSYFVEGIEDEIVITYRGGIPLIRYNTHDLGKVIPYEHMMTFMKENNIDVVELLKKEGYKKEKIWHWPFLYIIGKEESISIFGAKISPEDIEAIIYSKKIKEINSFRLKLESDKEGNTCFYILLELKKDIVFASEEKKELEKKYHDIFLKNLLELNLDFADAYGINPKIADPIIKIYHFNEGPFAKKLATKEKYILK